MLKGLKSINIEGHIVFLVSLVHLWVDTGKSVNYPLAYFLPLHRDMSFHYVLIKFEIHKARFLFGFLFVLFFGL